MFTNRFRAFILFAQKSQILPKFSVIPILLTFMYLVALNLSVKQPTQLIVKLNSSLWHIIVTNGFYTQVCWERISGKNLATSHLNSIKIWDIRNPNSPQHYINAHPSKIYALDFSPVKENQLVSSAADNTIKMWNVSKPQKPVNILKVRDGSPVWKVKYTVCRRIILFIILNPHHLELQE